MIPPKGLFAGGGGRAPPPLGPWSGHRSGGRQRPAPRAPRAVSRPPPGGGDKKFGGIRFGVLNSRGGGTGPAKSLREAKEGDEDFEWQVSDAESDGSGGARRPLPRTPMQAMCRFY